MNSNQWCRLWHDMANDPKWRLVAIKSGQPVANVVSVFVHMMTYASQHDDRGSIAGWDDQVIGVALDITQGDVEAIRIAMQGLVLEGDRLRGWDRRQPKREDNSAERTRDYRSRIRENVTQRDATRRNVTLEEIREEENPPPPIVPPLPVTSPEPENRTVKKASPSKAKAAVDPHDLVEIWNSICGPVLGPVQKLSAARRTQLMARFVGDLGSSVEQWRTFCWRIVKSPFLSGGSPNGWRPGFDWVIRPTNAMKIMEGVYDQHRSARPQRAPGQPDSVI